MKVKKLNGKLKEYDRNKLVESIKAANKSTPDEDVPDYMINRIVNNIEKELTDSGTKVIETRELGSKVEMQLMSSSYKKVAKNYIVYRDRAENKRVFNSGLYKQYDKKLNGKQNDRSNANCEENSFSGRMNEAARIFQKNDALNRMSKQFRENHENNEVYTHDLDSWSAGEHNCLSIPFDELFGKVNEGVHIKQTDIRSPKSINTAMQQIAVYMQIQSLQQFGGVAATHLDWTLIPSLRWSFYKHYADGLYYMMNKHLYESIVKDLSEKEKKEIVSKLDQVEAVFKVLGLNETSSIDDPKYKTLKHIYSYAINLTKRDALQGAEALIHNLNSLQSRSGQQLPFSSINYGTCTLTEGRIITNAILDATLDGTGPLHKTPIFPCGIFQYDEKINGSYGSPNYDLFLKALKCTSKRFYPNYTNVNWSVDVSMRMKDVEHKRAVLAKLSEDKMKTLVDWVTKNELEAYKYKMVLNEDKTAVVIDENIVNPVEIMSTMGKCKLQLI